MNRLSIAVLSLLLLASCSTQPKLPVTEPSVYAEPTSWFDNGRAVDPALADVFYILPTCVHDSTMADGTVLHHAVINDAMHRQRMQPSYELADQIFADSANFFAPYYRQVTLEAYAEPDSVLAARFEIAMDDVREAFAYYLRECNQGRPFVLAGFSQGGQCVVELVKEMAPATAQQMVAAYVCGYKVTAADTLASTNLRPALAADDTGVTIVYNTVTDTAGIPAGLAGGNVWVSNPASWTQDTLPHALTDDVSIRIDPRHKVLIADGIDAQGAFIPRFAHLFPLGCLHLQELTLYAPQLSQNVRRRIAAYSAAVSPS